MPDLPELLTVREVSQVVKRRPRWVREQLILTGKVKTIRLNGGPYLVYAESLAALFDLDGRRQKSAEYYDRESLDALASVGWRPRPKPGSPALSQPSRRSRRSHAPEPKAADAR